MIRRNIETPSPELTWQYFECFFIAQNERQFALHQLRLARIYPITCPVGSPGLKTMIATDNLLENGRLRRLCHEKPEVHGHYYDGADNEN